MSVHGLQSPFIKERPVSAYFLDLNAKNQSSLKKVVLDTNKWFHKTTVLPGELSIVIGAEYD